MFRFALVALFHGAVAVAQTPAGDPVISVVERLFVAMRASDTAATRAAFIPAGRVLPIQSGVSTGGLSVDQFVAFVGRNGQGSWIERLWNPSQRVNGALADLWFEYDVYKGATFDHCGANAVQLQQTGDGWKIVSMAFSSATQGCPTHPPPR